MFVNSTKAGQTDNNIVSSASSVFIKKQPASLPCIQADFLTKSKSFVLHKKTKSNGIEKETILLRPASESDSMEIVRVHNEAWKNEQLFATVQQFSSRFKIFPEGQIAAYNERGDSIGVISSFIADWTFDRSSLFVTQNDKFELTWSNATGNGFLTTHDPNGNTLVCPSVAVRQDYQKYGIAKQLVLFQKELAIFLGVKQLVAYSRPASYDEYCKLTNSGVSIDMNYYIYVTRKAEKVSELVERYKQTNPSANAGEIEEYTQEIKKETGAAPYFEWAERKGKSVGRGSFLDYTKIRKPYDTAFGLIHIQNGAFPIKLIPNGRPADWEARGWIVITEYPLPVRGSDGNEGITALEMQPKESSTIFQQQQQ